MNITNLNIVMLMFHPSVVVRGLEKNLSALGNNVSSIIGDFSSLDAIMLKTDLFIMNLPTKIADDTDEIKALIQVCNKINSKGKHLVMVGEKEVRTDLGNIFPDAVHYQWVYRPVEINTLTAAIEKTMTTKLKDASSIKRILIVDDDPDYARIVRDWIRDDFRVDIVTAGMKAITFLLKVPEDQGVDLILLDYEMPVVDGPQVLQMLRQEPLTASIPVVFLTGVGTRESVSRVMELKPEGYILKSTTREDLLKFLHGKLG